VYSVLPYLREMNRIHRHFVYISIDTIYNIPLYDSIS
jgi:hypothetical protein